MPPALALYITQYGYLAIFLLVFLQEIGVPNPVPNEIVLLFSGFLASTGVLSFPLVFLVVVMADFIGTSVLYFVFYYFDEFLFTHKPRWIPISREKINKLSERISKRGRWGIYLGRLIPYVRGYTSVAAGLLRIPPDVFLTTVIISAITWSGGYVIAGRIMGSYWQTVASKIGSIQSILLVLLVIITIIFLVRYFIKRRVNKKNQ